MDESRHGPMILVIWICVVMIAVTTLVPVVYTRASNKDITEEQIAACERENLVRVRVNQLARLQGYDGPPLRIHDCESLFG